MPERPIVVFDVNETLLDLDAIRPTFDRIFDDPAALRVLVRPPDHLLRGAHTQRRVRPVHRHRRRRAPDA
ncbi:hypothetical protein ACWD40_41290, partial [Streptomyces sp. NPDC002547]